MALVIRVRKEESVKIGDNINIKLKKPKSGTGLLMVIEAPEDMVIIRPNKHKEEDGPKNQHRIPYQ